MFGKIIELKDNYIYLENKLGRAETNLIGYHVIFNDSNKMLVGEIENISIERIDFTKRKGNIKGTDLDNISKAFLDSDLFKYLPAKNTP